MKRILLSPFLFLLLSLSMNAQVVINEVIFSPSAAVELKNLGSEAVTVDTLWLCSFPTYNQIQNLTVLSGSTTIAPGGFLVVGGHSYNNADDELGLYTLNGFGSSNNMVDYVEWGSSGHPRSTVAVGAGIWTPGDFVGDLGAAASLEYDGSGDQSSDWSAASTNSQGSENSNVEVECEASAFAVGNQSICPGESATFQVILTGIAPWELTYSRNGIVQDPIVTSDSPFAWELMEEGTYMLMTISDAVCEGPAQGTVQVNLHEVVTATIVGPTTLCSGDETPILELSLTGNGPWEVEYQLDGVPQGSVTVEDQPGGIPVTLPGFYNLTGVSDVNCVGTANGSAQVDFVDVDGGDLSVNGSTVDLYTCVDDGDDDNFQFDVSSTVGTNTVFVITNETGEILSLPSGNPISFEGSAAGICSVWNISYEDGLTGLAEGNTVPDDLDGCFSLSNPIQVIREAGMDCTTGLLDDEITEISLYPNPVQDLLFLDLDIEIQRIEVSVYSMTGALVLQDRMKSSSRLPLDVAVLDNGTYQLVVTDMEGNQFMSRFVK